MKPPLSITLLGFGAIGQALYARLKDWQDVQVSHVIVRPERIPATQALLRGETLAVSSIPKNAQLAIECAGHSAIAHHVLPALENGIECALLSIGALSEIGLPEKLESAAKRGNTQVHLLPGAIGAIDAIAGAKHAGLTSVRYTGRKPPLAWKGSPAEKQFDLESLTNHAGTAIIFEASAREAAAQYPKNANVAAAVSLAGLGLDNTQVRLIADGTQSENVHEIDIEGAFGKMHLEMRNLPLPDNPKTSMLTVLSALRFIQNRVTAITV